MSDQNPVQKRNTKRGFSRWQKFIVLMLLGINVCLLAGFWFLTGGLSSTTAPPDVIPGETLALREAYAQALTLALEWQADVEVVGATTAWQLAAGDALSMHRPEWSFSFFSPSLGQVQIVTVDRTGAQIGPRQAAVMVPQRVTPDWDLDSDDLLLTFLSYGGRDFVSVHPNANIHLQLKGGPAGRSFWHITAVDPVARETLYVSVDAFSRQVVTGADVEGGS